MSERTLTSLLVAYMLNFCIENSSVRISLSEFEEPALKISIVFFGSTA